MKCLTAFPIAFLIPAVAFAQAAPQSTPHARTCEARLHEYKSSADIKVPFDTLAMRLDPTPVDIDKFRSFMMARMAEIGATGFISHETVVDAEHSFYSFLPVFVPSDSARIRAECDADKKRPPVNTSVRS